MTFPAVAVGHSNSVSQLQDLKTGVLCLTPDNLNAPWILFEAGALSKALDDSLVCPYLFGIETAEVQWPLAQFQLEKAEEDGTRRLMTTINNAAGDAKLSEARFNQAFDMWWPKLRDQLRGIKPSKASVPKRDDRELLEEILGTVRAIRRNTQYDSAFEQLYSLSPVLKQLRGGTRQEAVDLQAPRFSGFADNESS